MLKSFVVIAALLPSVAFALDVKITSFLYAGTRTQAAELCGSVSGHKGMVVVHVTVDEQSKSPGHYRTIADTDGAFCVVVATNDGTAVASVKEMGVSVAAHGSVNQAAKTEESKAALPRPRQRDWQCSAHRHDTFFPSYSGYPRRTRYEAERSAIQSCEFSSRVRCVPGSCYQK